MQVRTRLVIKLVWLIYSANGGLCNPLSLTDESESSTEPEDSSTPNYGSIETNQTKLSQGIESPDGKLPTELNKSLMLQMCTQTISQVPHNSSLYLNLHLLCKLNQEMSVFNNSETDLKSIASKVEPGPLVNTKSPHSPSPITASKPQVAKLKKDKDKLDLELEGYDKQDPPKLDEYVTLPNGTDIHIHRPVTVRCYLFIRSIRGVDEIDEKVTVDMDMYLLWMDGRIRNELRSKGQKLKTRFTEHEPILVKIKKEVEDKIWIPDVLIEEVDKINRPQVLDEGGQVVLLYLDYGAPFLRLRMRATLDCGMDFYLYPADTQKCVFHLRSSSYKNDDVKLSWWKKKAHGVYLSEISDPNFDFQITGIDEYDGHIDIGPESPEARLSSHLKFELWIRRKMSYHLIQTYLPSVFFIIVTWLAYLIPPRMVEARIGVTMTTLLTMTSMFSSIRENTPIVGYVKAIDIWMVNCVFFIFMTLIALTVGACIRAVKGELKKKDEDLELNDPKKSRLHLKMKFLTLLEVFLEKQLVFLLLVMFVIFICLYWSWLLNGSSEYLHWSPNSTYNRM